MPFLRQSTIQPIRFGPFLDAGDGVTEEVALTITPALRRLSKDGAAFAAASGAVNSTHDSDGWYTSDLSAADTGTVGELILNVQVPATHLPVWMRWWVLEEAIYDLLFGAAATGLVTLAAVTHTGAVIPTVSVNTDMRGTDGVDTATMRGTDSAALASEVTPARMSELDAATGGKMANQVDLVKTEADKIALVDAGAGVAGSVIEEVENRALASEVTAARMSELDAATGGKMANQVDLIKTETDKIAAVDAGAGVAGSVIEEVENRATPAQVNAEVLDVVNVDTYALPGQVALPLAPTLIQLWTHLYKFLRNKKDNDGSIAQLYNDAGTIVDAKSTVSEAGSVVTQEKWAPGP